MAESPSTRRVEINIVAHFGCVLRDTNANHGCGYTIVGIGAGATIQEAARIAFEREARWKLNEEA